MRWLLLLPTPGVSLKGSPGAPTPGVGVGKAEGGAFIPGVVKCCFASRTPGSESTSCS